MSRASRGRSKKQQGPQPAPQVGVGALRRPLAAPLVIVALLLVALIDDRHVGLIADGRQMIRTAVALVESGGIGQAPHRDFSVPRPQGDGVSRFGMGTSLLQVPAAWLAPHIERWRGPRSSGSLFLLVPFGGVLVAAWAAGRITLELGGSARAARVAVLLASLGSPLGSYAALEFSEPVQAACLALALLAAVRASQEPDDRRSLLLAALSGAAAGFAVLVKTSLLAVAPFALLPLLAARPAARRIRSAVSAALGALPFLVLWAALEQIRFGHLFGGYPDDRFTNSILDGLWRLAVGPNRGLVFFFPACVLAAIWCARATVERRPPTALPAAAVALTTAASLLVAAGYWAWHGMEGWGPRFLVPALPGLAAMASLWLDSRSRTVKSAVVGVSCLVNAAPLVQHPTPVATYVMSCRWPEVTVAEAAKVPRYARAAGAGGATTVVPFTVLEREPSASGLLVYPWFLAANRANETALSRALAKPPWLAAQPGIVPPDELVAASQVRAIVPSPRIGFLGRSLFAASAEPYAGVYDQALLDQVLLMQQRRDGPRALGLARKLAGIWPSSVSDVALLESLRLSGLRDEAEAFLRSLPPDRRSHPEVGLVLALFARDAGDEVQARRLLGAVVGRFRGLPAERSLSEPLSSWPATLLEMTTAPRPERW